MKLKKRKCEHCGKIRRTTNREDTYICEICLRSTGKHYIKNIEFIREVARKEGVLSAFVLGGIAGIVTGICIGIIASL